MRILSIEFTANYIYLYEQKCKKSGVTVEKKYRIEMPTNTYYNRMLINNDRRISDAIKNCILEHKIKTKKVILVAPSTDCMIENMSILEGSKKQIAGMVEQELRKRHKLNTDYIYDYVVLGPDSVKEGFLNIQVTLCVKAMIQNAYDIVKKAGLVPYKIVFVNNVVEDLAKHYQLTEASESSVIACINEDEAHFLYVGYGQEPYYRYSKIKTEQRTEENFFILSNINQTEDDTDYGALLRRKVTEDITRLMRFHSQRYPGKEIANIYLYGNYGELNDLTAYLGEFLSIPTSLLQMEKDIPEVTYKFEEEECTYNGVAAAISFAKNKEDQYDFFERLEEQQAGNKDKFLFVPTIISVLILLIILFFTYNNRKDAALLESQTQELNEYLASQEIKQAYEEKNAMIELCGVYTKYNNQVAEAIELLETMPRFDSELIQGVNRKKPEGTVITSYIFQDGLLNIGCYANDQYAPAKFAKVLEESEKYEEVSYSGFQKNKGLYGEENYSFTITIKKW